MAEKKKGGTACRVPPVSSIVAGPGPRRQSENRKIRLPKRVPPKALRRNGAVSRNPSARP